MSVALDLTAVSKAAAFDVYDVTKAHGEELKTFFSLAFVIELASFLHACWGILTVLNVVLVSGL